MNPAHVALARARPDSGWEEPGRDPFAPALEVALATLGLDAARRGTPEWNPLADLVPPGGRVVIKPNMVRHRHGKGGPLAAVVTDPRLTRALAVRAAAAVGPGGQVIIADSPLQSCDFAALSRHLDLDGIVAAAGRHGARVQVLDYRREEVAKGPSGLITRRTPLAGDPEGYVAVDLGRGSALASLFSRQHRFRVTQYDRAITARQHDGRRHEFLIPRSLLLADLVISVPKLKTHRKAGMTGALKNLVGINGAKAWLPHHRAGSVREGGDEYLHPSWRKRVMTRLWERMDRTPSLASRRVLGLVQGWIRRSGGLVPFPDPYFEGSWWGNVTMAAMVCDLNRIFLYAGPDGRLESAPARKVLVVADGVLAGEGEGPLEPTPVPLGVLLAGGNPVAVDWVAATLMGFDPSKIPTLCRPWEPSEHPLTPFTREEIRLLEAGGTAGGRDLEALAASVGRPFVPASGWIGHIEAAPTPLARAG